LCCDTKKKREMKFTLVVLAAVAVAAFADFDASFVSNVNLSNAEADFKYRWQYAEMLDTKIVGFALPDKCYVWSSGSVDGHASSSSYANADGMVAVAFPPAALTYPFAVLGYASGEASVKVDLSTLLQGMVSGSSVFKGGMVALAVLNIQEMTPDGKPVLDNILDLKNSCNPTKIGDNEVSGMTCTESFASKSATVTYTYVTSTKAGILKYGETPVSPRSIETIVDVKGFTLTNKDNHARMNIAILTGEGAGNVQGNATIVTKDKESIYVAVSSQAIVNGKAENVNINFASDSNSLDLVTQAMMKVVLGANYNFRIAHVDFPAGVESFVYDPAAGTGRVVYEAAASGASTAVLSILAALVCALLFLF